MIDTSCRIYFSNLRLFVEEKGSSRRGRDTIHRFNRGGGGGSVLKSPLRQRMHSLAQWKGGGWLRKQIWRVINQALPPPDVVSYK